MSEQQKFDNFLKRAQYPQVRKNFFERPHWTRRRFFQLTGAGVSGARAGGEITRGTDGAGRAGWGAAAWSGGVLAGCGATGAT